MHAGTGLCEELHAAKKGRPGEQLRRAMTQANNCIAAQPDGSVVVRPARNLLGSVRLPGDKSVSHRYAMLGAIAGGRTRLTNFSTGADCASTLACVEAGLPIVRGKKTISLERQVRIAAGALVLIGATARTPGTSLRMR